MNQQQFRLVFSRRLGMRVAVSEVARCCARAASGGSRRQRHGGAQAAAPVLSAMAWALAAPLAAPLPAAAQTARPPVAFATQLGAPRQPLPQPYGSTRRADGSSLNDPSRRSFIANPAHAGQVRWTVDGQTATLDQGNIDRLVLNWDSFDIGAGYKVHFRQNTDPARYVSALNRIWSSDPSVIRGALTADREVVLLNPNGVYFGRNARVDTGKFVASALGIADSVFERGLRNITNGTAVFSTDGTDHLPTALVDSDTARSAAISVEAGAELRSAAGGDVLLVAPRVVNAGRIVTPQGQAVLAAGSRVYLMSSSDPAQRGLIVAVDPVRLEGSQQADPTLGTVDNRATGSVKTVGGATVDDSVPDATSGLVRQLNEIRADRGSINLVGLTVRQNGQANATTAVKGANGAIYLQAMAGTTPVVGSQSGTAVGFGLNVETGGTARVGNGGGTVQIGSASTTAVLPDASQATQIDAEVFNRSRIRVEGGAITVAGGAQVLAPAGQVDVVAAQTALTSPLFNSLVNTPPAAADASRISIAPGASISVAGLQDVAVDGARYQGSQRLFRIELADVPAQRSTPLYRSEVFFDLRRAAQLAVADVSGAALALPRTAQELSTAGGSLRIEAEGAVVVGAGAQLDVSGGSVKVSGTTLQETLLARGGRSLAFSEALAAQAVDGVAATRRSTRVAGYTEGRAGGSLQVSGRQLVLAGTVRGTVVQGERQAGGTDPQADAARLGVGRLFGVNRFHYLPALDLAPGAAATPDAAFWADPLATPLATLPALATLSLAGLGGSAGFGVLQLSAQAIGQSAFGTLDLGPGGRLVADAETLSLDGQFQAAGGRITLTTTRAEASTASAPGSGDILLSGRSTLDVAGRWTNAARGTTADALPADDGGNLAVNAARSLRVAPGARLDVSGGASMSASGKLATGDAGRIDLAIGRSPLIPTTLQLEGALLQGFDFGRGGTLNLGTPGFTWGASAAPSAFSLPGAVLTGAQGFGSIQISADGDVRLASGNRVAPVLHNWLLAAGAAQVPSGAMSPAVARSTVLDGQLAGRAPVSLSLSAALPLQPALGQPGASLVVERGAAIVLEPGARLTLQASRNLSVGVEGGQAGQVSSLQAPGGHLALRTTGQRGAGSLGEAGTDPAGFLPDQALWLGADARLSTAGVAVLRPEARADAVGASAARCSPADGPRLTGRVLDGGQITLDAQRGYLVAQAGSAITLDGAQARLQVPGQTGAVTVASAAGQLTLRSAEGMALEGTVSAAAPRDAAGRALADGGRLTLALGVGGVATFTQGNAYPGSLVDNLQGNPIPGAVAKPRSLRVGAPDARATAAVGAAAGGQVDWLQALDNG
ncbi:MAG: filamentous hemagglutinin N-terminal domain-containing protein, partial [Aquabacterium sp.]|nr:filamentous hemagglutinin N-terminal domain-containing protein [Aquabacterium sp.]